MSAIDENFQKVIHLAGIQPEQITDQVLVLADHLLMRHPNIPTAGVAVRQQLISKGVLR